MSYAKLTSLELREMALSMSIIIIKNSNGPRTVHSTQNRMRLADVTMYSYTMLPVVQEMTACL